MAEEISPHKRPIVYTIPGMKDVDIRRDLECGADLHFDAYLPQGAMNGSPLPGVVFIHGGPVPLERGSVKDSGQYRSWGALVAAAGFAGFTINHHYHAPDQLVQSAENVLTAVNHIRERASDFNLDPERLCLWTCSGGGPHICFALRERPSYIRCLVAYYCVLDLRPVDWLVEAVGQEVAERFSAVTYLDQPLPFPIFLGRAGQDHPEIMQIMDDFAMQGLKVNTNLELMNHPQGEHGFDIMNDDDRSHQIIARTLTFMQENVL